MVLALAVQAFGADKTVAVMMPEKESEQTSESLARDLASQFGIAPVREDLTAALEGFECYRRRDEAIRRAHPQYDPAAGYKAKITLPPNLLEADTLNVFFLTVIAPDGTEHVSPLSSADYLQIVAASNFKQRARMSALYFHAEVRHYAVLGTANKNEHDQGFFVKYGDGGVDIKPIAHLYKTQIYQLAEYLGIPAAIRERTPTTDTYSAPSSQQEFFFRLPFSVMDLLWYGMDHQVPVEEVARVMGLNAAQVARAFADFRRKARTTAVSSSHAARPWEFRADRSLCANHGPLMSRFSFQDQDEQQGGDKPARRDVRPRAPEAPSSNLWEAIGHVLHDQQASPPLRRVPRIHDIPASFPQERLWFLEQVEPGNPFLHIPLAWRIKGLVNVERLERSLNEIVQRHEILRTGLAGNRARPCLVCRREASVPLGVRRLEGRNARDRETELSRLGAEFVNAPFDLSRPPLLRANLYRHEVSDHLLLVVLHQAVFDGWSKSIFGEELKHFYAADTGLNQEPLPELCRVARTCPARGPAGASPSVSAVGKGGGDAPLEADRRGSLANAGPLHLPNGRPTPFRTARAAFRTVPPVRQPPVPLRSSPGNDRYQTGIEGGVDLSHPFI